MNKPIISVVLGGASAERPVSLKTGLSVASAIDHNRYQIILVDGATSLQMTSLNIKSDYQSINDYLSQLTQKGQAKPLLFFLCLHGTYGEDGYIQNILEKNHCRYTFSNSSSSANAMNKVIAKKIFRKHKLLTANHIIIKTDDYNSNNDINIKSLPVVVKPVSQGSSFGISIAHNQKELTESIAKALKFDHEVMIEEYIKGRELTVAVVGNNESKAMPVIEIIPTKTEFFDYFAKYNESGCLEICPADIPKNISKMVQEAAVIAHKSLKCSGISRSDFIWKEGSDQIYILETNTIPGMTPTSLLPKSAKADGYTFKSLVQKIIDLALDKELT